MDNMYFRVWNKKTNKWIYNTKNKVYILDKTILLGEFLNKISINDLDGIVVEQYIGFYDKNKQPIFVGDICSIGYGKPIEIKSYSGGFGYDMLGDAIGFVGHSNLQAILSNIEIIGNVHENFDLIKGL